MYRAALVNDSGRRSLTPDSSKALAAWHAPMRVPCGRCIGCRLERSRQWAVRCMHEARYYSCNSFVTLTYSDEFLPLNGSLSLYHYQCFLKRLRERLRDSQFRYFGCGEYGETFGRPHYHLLFFGHDFSSDRIRLRSSAVGTVYTSELLSDVWGMGNCEIGELTFESAAYVARYCVKKLTGDREAEYGSLLPEFGTMSRRPGIGSKYLSEFGGGVYPNDFIVVRGARSKPPRFYDAWLERNDPAMFERVKSDRADPKTVDNFLRRRYELTEARLSVREEVADARLGKRSL